MQYINTKHYKTTSISGYTNISCGRMVNCENGVILYCGRSICYVNSQNGHKHFANNEDGRGKERGLLTYAIAFANRWKKHSDGHYFRFSEEELKLLEDKYSHWLKQKEPLLFNNDFFAADVDDLKKLARDLHIKVKGVN